MKRNNPKRNFSRYILGLIIGSTTLISCGTSQHITGNTDGIYEDEVPTKRKVIVVQEQNNPRSENSFTKELRRLEDLQEDEIITDINSYHSDNYEVEVEPVQRTQINNREYNGWGASHDYRDPNVSISINTLPTWGYSGWYNREYYNSWYGGVYDYNFYSPWHYRYGFDYGYYRPYWNTRYYGFYNRWNNRPYRYYRNPYYYGYRYNRPVYRSNPRRRGTVVSRRGVSGRNSNIYRRPSTTTRRSSNVYRRGTTPPRTTRRTTPTRRSSRTTRRKSSSNRTYSPSRRNSSTSKSRSYSSSRSSRSTNRNSSPSRRSSSSNRRR